MSVPTGDSLLGRIIDPLGILLMIKVRYYQKVLVWWKLLLLHYFTYSCKFTFRTGLKVVDSLIPIGHGQRELLLVIQKRVKHQ